MAQKQHTVILQDDITDKLDRAQALAYVLADAAGGDLGVEAENVHHVGLVIAGEIKAAQEMLARYLGEQSQKAKNAA